MCLQCRGPRFDSWVRKSPWRRKWQPTPVPLPGKSHRQRSLVGYSLWGHKESDTTEQLLKSLPCWVSAVKQCKSAIIIHTSPPSRTSLPSLHPIPPGHHGTSSWAPCATQHLPSAIYLIPDSIHNYTSKWCLWFPLQSISQGFFCACLGSTEST